MHAGLKLHTHLCTHNNVASDCLSHGIYIYVSLRVCVCAATIGPGLLTTCYTASAHCLDELMAHLSPPRYTFHAIMLSPPISTSPSTTLPSGPTHTYLPSTIPHATVHAYVKAQACANAVYLPADVSVTVYQTQQPLVLQSVPQSALAPSSPSNTPHPTHAIL